MDSSKVAFERFERWKNSKTVLNFTVLKKDGTLEAIWTGRVISVEPDDCAVGFVDEVTRDGDRFDFSGATFRLEELAIVVSHVDLGMVRIEERLVI